MCPKTKAQFAAIRIRSEEKILNAALELFATKGFTATSIASIAQAANISKGLIYNYFDSKTDLLRAIVQGAMRKGTDIIQDAIETYDSPLDEIRHIVLNSIEHIKSNLTYWKLLTALSHQPEVSQEIRDVLDQNSQWSFQKGVELFTAMKARDPVQSSMLFGAALDGLFVHYLHLGEPYPLDMIGQTLIDTFTTNSIHLNWESDA
jgi:AcrR family transcriptional regulator